MKKTLDNIFKAYDVRGKVGSELNKETSQLIGKAFAKWLPKEGEIIVGRDMRPDSDELARALTEGLMSQGRSVISIGEVTSDMIYFAVGNLHAAGGVMITASHNPGEYNGIKFCREEAKPVGEETGLFEIRDLAKTNEFTSSNNQGSVRNVDVSEDWIHHVLSFIKVPELKELSIAVDAGNGMAGKIFPELEPYVPFKVTELFFELDGTFPNHVANPLEIKNLKDVREAIKKYGCDAGVAFDGDGDRAVLIDEDGEPLSGTVMTALLAEYFLKENPGTVILYNAICGRVVPELIASIGGKSIRTRVGHSFIKDEMRKNNAIFGGEHSGHYYFRDNFMADSGLIAAVVGLYILSVSGKRLSELAKPFREKYMQIQETNFTVTDKDRTLSLIAEEYKKEKCDWLDGLTVSFSDSWFNVRPSNTEPLLRLNAEAKDRVKLETIVSNVTSLIRTD